MGWTLLIFGGTPLLLGFVLFGFLMWMMLAKGGEDAEDSGDGGGGSKTHPRPRRPGPTHARALRGPVRMVKADVDSPTISRPEHQTR